MSAVPSVFGIGIRVPTFKGGLAPNALRRVCEYIDRSITQRIVLRDLADIAGLSQSHFTRMFKRSVGVSPHRFIARRRVELAAQLMMEPSRALSEIAFDIGCCDQSHFTRLFARHTGETPRAYRLRRV